MDLVPLPRAPHNEARWRHPKQNIVSFTPDAYLEWECYSRVKPRDVRFVFLLAAVSVLFGTLGGYLAMNERRGPRVQSSGRANATIVQSASSVSAPVVASGVTSAEVEPPLLEKCELVWPKRLPKVTVVETTKNGANLRKLP